jgi:hypothetical protein
MKWNYDGNFLRQFPSTHTGAVANVFCECFREGNRDVVRLLAAVRQWAISRLLEDGRYTEEYQASQSYTNGAKAYRLLASVVDTEEAERFANFIIWRESLSREEKWRLKEEAETENRETYIRVAMSEKPPTEKQLAYLKRLNVSTVPQTRLEASELIEVALHGDVQRQS